MVPISRPSGLRNPIGLDFHPITGELYATVNERDKLGDDGARLSYACATGNSTAGLMHLTPNNLDPRQVQNGKSKRPDKAASTQTPDVLFQAHSAALGLQFYDRKTFPKNIATVPLSPFVALGIAITAPATKLCLFPSTPIIVRKATTKTFSPVSCSTQLSRLPGADQLAYSSCRRQFAID